MKGILFGAVLAALGQNACARKYPYAVAPGLPAVVTVSGLPDQRLRVRVDDGPEHEVARLGGDEEVDQFQSVDVDRDGYRDFAIGQSGGGGQVLTRIFLYRPQDRAFRELPHPDSASSPCHGFVNPVFDDTRPAFAVACRYAAADHGFEEYAVCPDGTAQAASWSRRSGESLKRLPLPAPAAATCRIRPKRR
ncbi:MAG: hypothetical protein OJK14_12950 [Achromobacter sp.]|uniref:XAC2610-related protein n=1 Tax=Achromobacter sp. TaxID=134375 RepID=UPI0025879CB2|nr:hypothetical protein [Achromobacter sp.]MCW0207999.1 hypothetical protein [Achromobacter sp.]